MATVERYVVRDSNGRYRHSKFNRICKKCGHTLGQHSAEKSHGEQPCFHGDFVEGEHCDCECFVPSNKFSDEPTQVV